MGCVLLFWVFQNSPDDSNRQQGLRTPGLGHCPLFLPRGQLCSGKAMQLGEKGIDSVRKGEELGVCKAEERLEGGAGTEGGAC